MSIKPSALFEYARSQLTSKTDETVIRSAVSRAYYSCFHALSPLMEPFPGVTELDTWLSHKELIHRLESWNVGTNPKLKLLQPQANIIAQKLRVLRKGRTAADYLLDLNIQLDDLRESVARADELRKKTAQLKIAMEKAAQSTDEREDA